MKILYLHNEPPTSTMANLVQVKAMCKAMVQLGHDVTLSLLEDTNTDSSYNENDYSFRLHVRKRLFKNKRLGKYLNAKPIKWVINEFNPDIIYLRNPLLLKQTLSAGRPVVMELHNNKLHLGYDFLNKYWERYLVKAAHSKKVSKIVCISKSLASFWINKGIPESMISVAHDAVDDSIFRVHKKDADANSIKRDMNLPENRKIVTYAGSLYKDRKIENIIEMAKAFKDAFFLIIGGSETQKNEYKKLALDMNITNILFTGRVAHEQIPLYLHASDVLLALWSSEVKTMNYCSPLKVFEYMAMEKIIVAHGFITIKEVLTHNKNALLVEPDSLHDLKEKLKLALQMDYPSEMAQQARKDVLQYYTWQKRAKFILADLEI